MNVCLTLDLICSHIISVSNVVFVYYNLKFDRWSLFSRSSRNHPLQYLYGDVLERSRSCSNWVIYVNISSSLASLVGKLFFYL